MIGQTSIYVYNVSGVTANYLNPLAKNDFTISDMLSFPDILKKRIIMKIM